MTVLIVVTHLLGAGHLTRAAALARAFVEAGDPATLVSGGGPSPLLRTGGARFVQLPPVSARIGDFRTLRDDTGEPAGARLLAARRELLLETLREVRPDILVTELYPFGRRSLSEEFDALLDAADRMRPRPLVACSIRDVLAPPSDEGKRQRSAGRVRRFYDAVLVHGDASVLPLEASWPVDPELRTRLAYTGYVDDDAAPPPHAARDGSIVVSGGSSAAGLPLYRAALGAAAAMPDRPWRILVGHGVGEAELATLAQAAGPNVTVERARADFRSLLARAALLVGQAGYNTVTDILATGVRALLVPFAAGGETEQSLRAATLADSGLVSILPEDRLDDGTLAEGVARALAASRPAIPAIGRDGARETVRLLASLRRAASPLREAAPA